MNKYLWAVAVGASIGTWVTMLWVFFRAYFNGYQILVTINDYHEAHIEAIIMPILFLTSLYCFWKEFS